MCHLINNAKFNRTHLKPLVNTLGVELMITGEDSEELTGLKVTHAYDASTATTEKINLQHVTLKKKTV